MPHRRHGEPGTRNQFFASGFSFVGGVARRQAVTRLSAARPAQEECACGLN
jgi:hypothetical protein